MPYDSIRLVSASGDVMATYREAEAATQTFKKGVPLRLNGSGMLIEADAADPWSAADVVYGVSAEPGHNLTTANVAMDGYSEGTPPHQPNAKQIPVGAWMRDGKIGTYRADSKNEFLISLATGQVFTQALIVSGTYYTLKKDATTGFWFLDATDTTGNNAVAELLRGVSDDDTKVIFRFKASQRFFD